MNNTSFNKLLKSVPEQPTTMEQIKTLKQNLKVHLSQEQVDFLLSYAGSCFQTCEYFKEEAYVQSFFQIDQIEGWYQLLKVDVELEMGIYCYTDHLIPIAATSFYNEYLCLPTSPLFCDGVWAMNYNIDESDLLKSEWKARVVQVSSSIDEFLTICANNVLC